MRGLLLLFTIGIAPLTLGASVCWAGCRSGSQRAGSLFSLAFLICITLLGAARPLLASVSPLGDSWNGLGPAGTQVNNVIVDPNNPATLYAGTTSGVWASADGGQNWSLLPGPPLDSYVVEVDPSNPLRLYAGSGFGGGMFRSEDGGSSWGAINTGLGSSQSKVINVIEADTGIPCTVFIGTNGEGIRKSTNCGASWSGSLGPPFGDQRVLAIEVDPTNSSRAYMGTQGGGVFRSLDGGMSWTQTVNGIPNFPSDPNDRAVVVDALIVDPTNPMRILVGFRTGGVYVSTDGADSWSALNCGIPLSTLNGAQTGKSVSSFRASPSDPGAIFVACEGDGVFRLGPGETCWADFLCNLTNLRIRSLASGPAPASIYAGSRGDGVFVLVPTLGAISGTVTAGCPEPDSPLLGVRVDAYEVGAGGLAGTGVTDGAGHYTIAGIAAGDYVVTIVTPLGYTTATPEVPASLPGCPGPSLATVDFALNCVNVTAQPRTIGFWKHQVGVATGSRGTAQIDGATLCSYLDLVAAHFNSNALNQVAVYIPPLSGLCADKLQVAKTLLNLSGSQAMIARARQQLLALLLNVAAGYIGQNQVISIDGATVSQAITHCDNLVDDSGGDHEKAKTIADTINNGQTVAAGMIPLGTAQIAYRRGMETLSFRVTPNPGSAAREFRFVTAARGPVTLALYDVSGRLVAEIYRGAMNAGVHSVRWEGRTSLGNPVARGLYFARLQTPRESPTIKVLQLTRE